MAPNLVKAIAMAIAPGRLKMAEGLMDYLAPQIAGREERFRSAIREHLKGHTEGLEDLAIEMLARGLSVRDIEDAFKDEDGRLLLSRTAVSQLGERLWKDYVFPGDKPNRPLSSVALEMKCSSGG